QPRPQSPGAPRPGMRPPPSSAGGSGGGAGANFDPVKVLLKYKFVLIAAIGAGIVLGVVAHFAFSRFAPKYTSTVLFECSAAGSEVQTLGTDTIDEDEMARFIGTQVATMRGKMVIDAVLNDNRLQAEAPNWYKKYSKNGTLDVINGFDAMEKIIKVHAIPNSYLISLSVKTGDKNDAAGLVRLVRENYMSIINSSTNSTVTKQKEAIKKAIADSNKAIDELSDRKNRLLKENNIEMIDPQTSAQAEQLRYINAQIINNQSQIEAFEVILKNDEAQLRRNTPVEYDSTLRDRVDQMPQILTLKQTIISFKSQLLALQAEGIQPDHRTYKLVLNTLEANERKLEDTKEELLAEAFEARIDGTRLALNQLRAQNADLLKQQEALQLELNQLTLTSEEITDIDRQIENTLTMLATHEANLSELSQSAGLDTAKRIKINTPESVPDRPSFPIIYIMVPMVTFLVVGLVTVVIVIFEMLDQRVKSAADIAMIPRTPILGIIADAEEDPTKHDSIATLFADSPNSVLAEHYRQLRTKIVKRMAKSGHKSLLVVGGMPGSGATSVACNIAQACMASGKKTLLIDTNYRKAKIHTAFGIPEAPGLADMLADEKTLSECIQTAPNGGPDILAAGTRNLRVVERLGTQPMGELLAQVSADYDMVILDVAPAIVAGDANMLSNQVDSTMLVVKAMSEKRGQVARLKNELSDSRSEFLGVLVNSVRSSAGGYMRKNIRTSHQYHEAGSETAA
ncbi:MAG: polysaccharide biosynthesis tyrosine autokinase, partial [Phycisphaerales bacterium]